MCRFVDPPHVIKEHDHLNKETVAIKNPYKEKQLEEGKDDAEQLQLGEIEQGLVRGFESEDEDDGEDEQL